MKWRFWILFLGAVVVYGVLGLNLYNVQVKKSGYYSAKAASQFKAGGFLSARRGSIYITDKYKNQVPAALDKEYPVIFAVPKEVKEPEVAAEALSKALGMDKAVLGAALGKSDDAYELLVPKAADHMVKAVRELNIPGIYIGQEEYRFYPLNALAAQVFGFVGRTSGDDDLKGRYGLEREYENDLKGRDGRIDGEAITHAVQGESLSTTIDRNIQSRAEEILENLITTQGAEGGLVIVQEPSTGKILAMAGKPSFDPNSYSEFPLKSFLNPAVQTMYEPGSIFKIITMAIGIDAGKITPETTFYDTGSLTLNGRTIKNWDEKAHGQVTMTEVIQESINTGAAFAVQKIGQETFYNYLVKFNIEEPTGITLPGEIAGSLKSLKNNSRAINFATASYGQGVAVTPLRLITMVSAIANKGLLMKPYLLTSGKPQAVRAVVSEAAAREVTKMMVNAVQKARIARISGYRIAGKTGTAEIPDFKKGGYTDALIHSYAGFAPASNPRFTALIKLDKPKNAEFAGLTVVPAFRELSEFILNYYRIPPDDLGTNQGGITAPEP